MRLRDWLKLHRGKGAKSYSDNVRYISTALGVSVSAVYGYANGSFMPSLENAVSIFHLTRGAVLPESFVIGARQTDKGQSPPC